MTNQKYKNDPIKQEIVMALKSRYVDISDDRVDELAEIVSRIYTIMGVYKVTYKEAQAILTASECMLDKVSIGTLSMQI